MAGPTSTCSARCRARPAPTGSATGRRRYSSPAGACVFLFAAGPVAAEGWLARRKPHAAVKLGAVMLISAAIGLPIDLPVLPARALHTLPLEKINYDLDEAIGG